jgi:hypothetical protein
MSPRALGDILVGSIVLKTTRALFAEVGQQHLETCVPCWLGDTRLAGWRRHP